MPLKWTAPEVTHTHMHTHTHAMSCMHLYYANMHLHRMSACIKKKVFFIKRTHTNIVKDTHTHIMKSIVEWICVSYKQNFFCLQLLGLFC